MPATSETTEKERKIAEQLAYSLFDEHIETECGCSMCTTELLVPKEGISKSEALEIIMSSLSQARAEERERCAKVVEEVIGEEKHWCSSCEEDWEYGMTDINPDTPIHNLWANKILAAIRSLGEGKVKDK